MNETLIFWLCIAASVLGLGVIFAVIWFGKYLVDKMAGAWPRRFPHPKEWLFYLEHRTCHVPEIWRMVSDAYRETIQRRNEYWTIFNQSLLAILVSTSLIILLLTKTISPESGLPILAGISGFAIAKNVSSYKMFTIPEKREEKRE